MTWQDAQKSVTGFAKATHKNRGVYVAYGALDTLNLAPKMLELFYESTHGMQNHTAATADMYDWLRTPEGITTSTLGIVPLVGISAFANYFFPSKHASQKAIYRIWQMIRDAIKGIKNAVRGIKSSISTIRLLTLQNFSYLLMPVGFLLGFISAGNRIWNRCMVNERKDMQDENENIVQYLYDFGQYRHFNETLPENLDELSEAQLEELETSLYGFVTTPDGLFYIHQDDHKKTIATTVFNTQDKLAAFYAGLAALPNRDRTKPSLIEWNALLSEASNINIFDLHEQARQQFITQKNQNIQSEWLKSKAYLSAAFGGFIDGLYMFMGLVTLTALSGATLAFVASMSIFFSAICILTRLHEERDFQRTLMTTQKKAHLALLRSEIEQNAYRITINQPEPSDSEAERAEKLLQNDIRNFRINEIYAEFQAMHASLFDTLKITGLDVFLMSLRQALIAYTALVCSVSAIALISLVVFATPLPQVVALTTAALGIVFLISAGIHAALKTDHYTKSQATRQTQNEQLINNRNFADLRFEATPAYPVFCWSDAFRAGFSGVMKAVKFVFLGLAVTEATDNYDSHNPLFWLMLIPSILIASMVWAFRSLGKNRKALFGNEHEAKNITGSDGIALTAPPNPPPAQPNNGPNNPRMRAVVHQYGFFDRPQQDGSDTPSLPAAPNTATMLA